MRRRSKAKPQPTAPTHDPLQSALGRARKARRQGCARDEVNALRKACALDEEDAALWTLLGAAFLRMARPDDALEALRQALWLRERADDIERAAVTRRLIREVLRRQESRARAA